MHQPRGKIYQPLASGQVLSPALIALHWRIQGALPAPPVQDQFLSFLHTFLPKSACVGGWRPPTGNPGSATALLCHVIHNTNTNLHGQYLRYLLNSVDCLASAAETTRNSVVIPSLTFHLF